MIEIKEIRKKYGNRTVVDISSLAFRKGETVVIVGPNGSGKSTFLKILAGVIKAEVSDFSVSGSVLYLPQRSLPFSRSLVRNVTYGMKDRKNKKDRAQKILDELGLLSLKSKNAKTLSGGECQRLALARVLVNDCDFLLLDEPSSAADIEGNELIEKAIFAYRERTGCGVIMTTHSPSQAKKFGERIIMLNDGRIVEDSVAEEILKNPKNKWTEKFISQWSL